MAKSRRKQKQAAKDKKDARTVLYVIIAITAVAVALTYMMFVNNS